MEFLLIVIPLLVLSVSTISVVWYSFERISLRVLATEAGWRFAQPDFDYADLQEFVSAQIKNELGMNRFVIETEKISELNRLSLLVDSVTLPGGLGLSTPELKIETHAVLEN